MLKDILHRYDKARQIKQAQDTFCHKVLSGQMTEEAEFPEELQWEAAVDVLRGKVKVSCAIYGAYLHYLMLWSI